MKTIVITLALVLTFFAQFSFSNNLNIELKEENYINDIPFNTEVIASSVPGFLNSHPELFLDEESYIDDIPFNTGDIVSSIQNNSVSPEFTLEEENYINDIPFDTKKIAMSNLLINNLLSYEEEKYIDDIPFNTYEVSTNSIEYYQIILSNMSNKIQSIFNNYYDGQIENLTQNILKKVIIKIENKSIEIIN